VEQRRVTLWPWPLIFWPWHCLLYCSSHARPIHQFWLCYGYRLPSYELLNLITHFRLRLQSLRFTTHAPCHVTYHRRAKMVHIFEILDHKLSWPQFTLSLSWRYAEDSAMLSPKTAFIPLWKLQSSHARDIEDSPKADVTIRLPQIVYSLYNFYGTTMTIKGTFVREHAHVKVVFGCKRPVKIGPQNGGFLKIYGSKYKTQSTRTRKGTSLPGTTSIDVFCANIRSGV